MAANDSDDDISGLDRLREMPIRSEDPGFAPDAMLKCEGCGRANAPTRSACIYCGRGLDGSSDIRLELRELESWETGYNVIVTQVAGDPASGINEISALLASDVETINAILTSGSRLPIARVENEQQAHSIADRLKTFGIGTRVLSDVEMAPSSPPVRLRAVTFGAGELTLRLFGKDESHSIKREDLALIFFGLVFQARTESIEKRKRRSTETLSEIQTSSDNAVIDIYSRDDPAGWRIPVSGFDFSCLAEDKSLFAGENIEKLLAKLMEYAPSARVVRDYPAVRSMLEHSWPSESRKDSLGPKRSGFERKSIATIFSTNNLVQLTKYSRLQWHLL